MNLGIAWMLALAVTVATEVTLFPLVDSSDPIRVSGAIFDSKDPDSPAIWMQLENRTSRPIAADQIWLRAAQFFTPSEMARNKDREAYSCGRIGRAEFDEVTGSLPPGQPITTRFKIGSDCALDAVHAHLFIYVVSIGPGPIDQAIWFRDPPSFVRLLAAAMPHQ